ncbi:MAG: ABC transporter substrate-binding protein [Burkholderiales bacterium]|nr:ABC transporter substrate-binding protein [Burkholderiales bacterium]
MRSTIPRLLGSMAAAATAAIALIFAAPAFAAPAQSVSLALDWVVGGTQAGYFVAADKGYYRDAGLEVTISRGFGSGDTVKRVASGTATFGIADTGTIIAARANEDVPVRIVAMVYQKATTGLIYLTESGIRQPKDLTGRKIGRSASGASVTLFPAFLKANGIERDKLTEVVVDGATFLPMLMSRQVDAVLEQSVNAARFKKMAARQGNSAASMRYSDFGVNAYGNAIIVNPKTLEANPALVRAFVDASLRGLAYAFAHPEEAIAILRKRNPEVDAEAALDELLAVRDVSVSDPMRMTGLGQITAEKMTATRDVITNALSLKRVLPIDEIYVPGYMPTSVAVPGPAQSK